MNQRVKMVLVRHGVNLTLLRWSSSQKTTYFYGTLKKDTDEDFTVQTLEALVKELFHMPRGHRVRFYLDNWDIGSDAEALRITKKKKPVETDTLAERAGTTVFIHDAARYRRYPAERKEPEKPEQESGDSDH
jgi:hypothetical protein